ncbi:MAG: hypothetical protein IKN12_04870 [Selenomonadaceae bacterium]|nr:hypothetical protein [Selenomonadaceae bacterium]
MKEILNWSTEKIIAVGITFAFIAVVIAADWVSVMKGSMEITAFGKEIAIGLFGYMGRGAAQAIDKKQANKESFSESVKHGAE